MLRTPSRELGSYVLEVAGVVMGLGIFILGAADVTRVFQARSAVRAAVNDGARCLFPTDAACVSRGPTDISPSSRRFDVWVWGSGYQIPQESFTASAQWQSEPVYQANILERPIKEVTVEHDQFQYSSRQVFYPTTANTPYLLQTRFIPVVTGGSGVNPVFADPVTWSNATPHQEYSLSNILGEVSSANGTKRGERVSIGTIDFHIEDAWPTASQDKAAIAALRKPFSDTLPCYAGYTKAVGRTPVLDWAATAPTECRYRVFKDLWKQSPGSKTFGGGAPTSEKLWQGGELRVPLMFHVSGSTKDSAQGSDGRLSIIMSWRNGTSSGVKELGGRVIGAGTSGNLIPRGLGKQDIDPDILDKYDSYKQELSLYEELPLIPYDARVTIHFYVETTNGLPIKWSGNTLKVFYPQFTFVHEKHNCGYTTNPAECVARPKDAPVRYVTLQAGAPLIAKSLNVDTCSRTARTDVELSERDALQKIADSIARGVAPVATSFTVNVPTNRDVCAPQISTAACGVATTGEYFEGCEPRDVASKATASCLLSGKEFLAPRIVGVSAGEPIKRTQRVRGCSDTPLPACARSFARLVENVPYHPTDSQSRCDVADITKGNQVVFGPFVASQCGDRVSEITDLYRTNEKIPKDVPVSVVRMPAPPLYSRDKPGGSCIAYYAAAADSSEMVCGLNLSSIAADRCCEESGGRCRRREVVTPGASGTGGWEAALLAAARNRVVDGVQASYPAARAQDACGAGDADCLQTDAQLGAGNETATVSAKVHVPVYLLKVIGDPNVTVEHSVTRRMEKTHVG